MRAIPRRLGATLPAVLLAAAGLQLTGGPAQAAESGDLLLAPKETALADSWIVVLKDGSASTGAGATADTARGLLDEHDGLLGQVYSNALQGFSATMSTAEATALSQDPRVERVEQNATVRADPTQVGRGVGPAAVQDDPTWGLDRIDQRDLPLDRRYEHSTTASNVTAYVIDTGIRTSHSDFGGRASVGTDTVGDGQNGQDCNGHGTHVAGTVGGEKYGVAKAAKLVAVRVLDCEGSGTTAGVAAGIDWVTAHATKPAVANMSLGGSVSATLDSAVERSIASGVTYSVAAGNGTVLGLPANACNYSPARVPEAITVGATDKTDKRASFSNYGTCVDVFAPGVDITSSWKDSDTATNTISGTSMAAPHTAGAAALHLADHPTATPAQVSDALTKAASVDKVQSPLPGSPNRLLYTGS